MEYFLCYLHYIFTHKKVRGKVYLSAHFYRYKIRFSRFSTPLNLENQKRMHAQTCHPLPFLYLIFYILQYRQLHYDLDIILLLPRMSDGLMSIVGKCRPAHAGADFHGVLRLTRQNSLVFFLII